jgi:hypothetical protein
MWLMMDQIKSKQCHFDLPRFSAPPDVVGDNSTGLFPVLNPQGASIPVLQILLYLSAATGS